LGHDIELVGRDDRLNGILEELITLIRELDSEVAHILGSDTELTDELVMALNDDLCIEWGGKRKEVIKEHAILGSENTVHDLIEITPGILRALQQLLEETNDLRRH